ncbi:MAG: hypothetical protein ACREMV_14315, partial [Gemmatimonadales bacterium]
VHAQSAGGGHSGPRALLPRDREIALARSAAPAAVADSATVFVLTARGYEAAVRGTNGAACYVSRDWLESLEPHCFDAEGAATVMALAMRRIELLHQGRTPADADREIADSLAAGRFRLPRRPAMSYMLSAAQVLYNDEGRRVGAWQPHLMIYYPYLTAADVGLPVGGGPPGLMVVDPGRPTANIMIVVREFVQPRFPEPAGR